MQELGVAEAWHEISKEESLRLEWLGHDPQQPLVVKHEAGREAKTVMEKYLLNLRDCGVAATSARRAVLFKSFVVYAAPLGTPLLAAKP